MGTAPQPPKLPPKAGAPAQPGPSARPTLAALLRSRLHLSPRLHPPTVEQADLPEILNPDFFPPQNHLPPLQTPQAAPLCFFEETKPL